MRNEGGQGGQGGAAGIAGPGTVARSGGMLRRDNIVKLIRHELNTPLATALLYLGIAEGSAAALPKGVVHSALRVARAEVQRLKTLLDTVTELECVGYATPRPRSINVGETVRATVQRLVAVRDATTVRVVTLGDLQGWWDRSMVEQIVGNLLSNALKFGLGRPIRIERQAGGVWRSHLGSRSRDRRRPRRSGMDLRTQHARHARGRRRAWPRALARSRACRRARGMGDAGEPEGARVDLHRVLANAAVLGRCGDQRRAGARRSVAGGQLAGEGGAVAQEDAVAGPQGD